MTSYDSGHIFNLNDEHKVLLREYWDSLFEYFSVNVDYSKCTTDEERAKERQRVIEGKLHKRSHMNLDNSFGDSSNDINDLSVNTENLSINDNNSNNNNLLSPSVEVQPKSPRLLGKNKSEKRSSFNLFGHKKSSTNINSNGSDSGSNSPVNSPPYHYNTPSYKGIAEIKLDSENILESMKEEFFFMMAIDEPDSVALRFLRARKWNVQKAVKMTTACLQWRIEWNVRALLEIGEEGIDKDVFNSGKAFIFGRDKENRPLSIVRVRYHNKNTVPLFESEKFTMFLMETGRLTIRPPVEMCSILFDMTDFSMNNMDYPYVKFVLHCLQNYYPECLGVCLILNAPWIFNGCWKIIKPLLDPVVSSKVHFIKTEDLKDYINDDQLMKVFGGSNSFEYKYTPPTKEEIENEKKTKSNDNAEKFKKIDEWRSTIKEYEEITKEWIKANKDLDAQCRIDNMKNADSLFKTEKSFSRSNSCNTSVENLNVDKDALTAEAEKIEAKRKEIGEKHKKIFSELIPYAYTKTYYHKIGCFDHLDEKN